MSSKLREVRSLATLVCNSRYVDTSDEEERIDVGEAVRNLRELEKERAAAEATMNRYLVELGIA